MVVMSLLGILGIKKIFEAENTVVLGMNGKTELVLALSEESRSVIGLVPIHQDPCLLEPMWLKRPET